MNNTKHLQYLVEQLCKIGSSDVANDVIKLLEKCISGHSTFGLQKISFIRKIKGKWCVLSRKGQHLGCYDTKAKADKRLRQIEFWKHKKTK